MKQFKTESKRILDLMINSIYTNKEIFLRELISNASDAIDKIRFISLTDNNVNSDFKINLSFDKENKQIIIEDNGIGMNEADLEKNLGTIAESGTLRFKTENADEKELIGQFGVGFYSAFMVAEKIEVYTKKYGEDKAYKWTSKGVEGYTVEQTEKATNGTKIVITLKNDDEDYKYSDFLSEFKLSDLVKTYSDYIRYPIMMEKTRSRKKEGSEDEYENYLETVTLNSMLPLWKKQKSQVSEEELSDFYKSNFYDYEKPLKSIYAKIEGLTSYDTLLFVPSHAPFDYFTKDYKKGVKLYSNGVLIMDKCEDLIPDYYGFIKGIVDSSDLSLNISREMLQQDRQVKQIASSLEKKITAELKKMQEEDRDNYDKMFAEFGLTIKFGIYNNFGAKKELLKDLIMFYSSTEKKLVTLSEYVKRMKPDQNEIYYVSGETAEKIDKLPQVEKVKEKGFEILYFTDNVDEFVVKILESYEEKKFVSISGAEFNLDSQEEKDLLSKKSEQMKDVLSYMKERLGDKVKEVRLSGKMKTYPACLTAEGDISIEMEKVINAMPNTKNMINAQKVLELNAEHRITEKLASLYENDKELLDKYTDVLYAEARILEGLPIEDVAEFVNSLSEII